jgi:hypothetical protein
VIPSTYRDLVDLLARKSEEGAVCWRGTNTIGRYTVLLGDVTYEVEDAYDENSGKMLIFRVRGDRGRSVDGFNVEELESDDWELMAKLYEMARRAVARVDTALALLRGASPDSPAGSTALEPELDADSIPF